jgi:hypothetical protein
MDIEEEKILPISVHLKTKPDARIRLKEARARDLP